MMTAAQLRAARGLLDWTRADLAKAAEVSPETVKNIEHGTFRPQEATTAAILKAFTMHDVEFIENEGVRLRRERVTTYEGIEGFRRFLDDVYHTAQALSAGHSNGKSICISGVDDRFFIKHLHDYSVAHANRMIALGNVKVRILIKEKVFLTVPKEDYREYRVYPTPDVEGNVPFYVYDDKLAIMIFDGENLPQIVVISSPLVARAYRGQFEVLWQNAKPISVDGSSSGGQNTGHNAQQS